MGTRTAKKLGEKRSLEQILLESDLITREALAGARSKAVTKNIPLQTVLVQENLITEENLAKSLAKQHDLEYIDLRTFTPSEELLKQIPEKILSKYLILPLEFRNDQLVVAIKDPEEIMDLNNITAVIQKGLTFKVAPESQLKRAVSNILNRKQQPTNAPLQTPVPNPGAFQPLSPAMPKPQALTQPTAGQEISESSVVTSLSSVMNQEAGRASSIEDLIKQIIESAIATRASDIHIEPDEKILRVRVRTDGSLRELQNLSLENHAPIISRMKVIAGLDIAEKRNAQDGSFQLNVLNRNIDFRLSTLPTVKGEKAVLRILDNSSLSITVDQLGMRPDMLEDVTNILCKPHGLILIAGPTGSGKTTTVYSMLNHINALDMNIITVEDPVELQFPVINQVQVNVRAGLTFPNVLRNILRQDPDAIMIGEVRDKETGDLTIRAALTGHIVISTIHTNDSISTVSRLVDMGIEPFLVSSALMGVLSQRLVRSLCNSCKEPSELTPVEIEHFEIPEAEARNATVFKAKGCPQCLNKGYVGRMPIFEFLMPNNQLRKLISQNRPTEEMQPVLETIGFKPMRYDGVIKVLQGKTTFDEVVKVTI